MLWLGRVIFGVTWAALAVLSPPSFAMGNLPVPVITEYSSSSLPVPVITRIAPQNFTGAVDGGTYGPGMRVEWRSESNASDAQMAEVHLHRHRVLPMWNYTIVPAPAYKSKM